MTKTPKGKAPPKGAKKNRPRTKPEDRHVILKPVWLLMAEEGLSMVRACEKLGLSYRRATEWLDADPSLPPKYARAMQDRALWHHEEMLRIADTTQVGVITKTGKDGIEVTTKDMIEHRRLQVETRKWILARMDPKRYGDKTSTEVSGPDGGAVKTEVTVRPNLEAFRAKLVGIAQGVTPTKEG